MWQNYHTSIHQTTSVLSRGALENLFEFESLAELKVWGWCKKLVKFKMSVKYEMKYIKLPQTYILARSTIDFD